jgi:pectate lyase
MESRCVDCIHYKKHGAELPCCDCNDYSEFDSALYLEEGFNTFSIVLKHPLVRFRSVHWYAEYYTLREIFEILSKRNNADIAMLVADGWEVEPRDSKRV